MAEPGLVQHGTSAAAPPFAHLVHQSRRRLRLKIPSRRHDDAFFERLEQHLALIPKIEAAAVNPATASISLQYAPDEGDCIAAALEALALVRLAKPESSGARPDHPATDDRISASNRTAIASARGDRRALAFTVMLLLLLRQRLRGGWLAPGLALLWFLFEVLRARAPQRLNRPLARP